MQRETPVGARRRNLRKTVAFSLVGAVLLFGGLEAAVRVYHHFRPGSESHMPAGHGAYLPHPFLQYVLNPELPECNALGFRGDEFPAAKPSGEVRVFCLGGSSTYGTHVPLGSDYPAQLQRVLHERGHRQVRVVNAGVPGYNSANLLALLQFRVLPLGPDVLIFYAGFNDCGAVAGARDTDLCYEGTLTPYREPSALEWLLSRSAVVRVLSSKLGLKIVPTHLHELTRRHEYSTVARVERSQVDRSEAIFRENLRSCLAIARERGYRVLLVEQLYRPMPGIALWVQSSMQRRNAGLRALAAEHPHVESLPLPELMGLEEEFFADGDCLHLSVAGNARRAVEVANALLELGWCGPAPPNK